MTRPKKSLHFLLLNPHTSLHFFLILNIVYIVELDEAEFGTLTSINDSNPFESSEYRNECGSF